MWGEVEGGRFGAGHPCKTGVNDKRAGMDSKRGAVCVDCWSTARAGKMGAFCGQRAGRLAAAQSPTPPRRHGPLRAHTCVWPPVAAPFPRRVWSWPLH